MTKKEQVVIQYVLGAMVYLREASELCIKLPEKDTRYLIEDYLCDVANLTHELGLGLVTLKTSISNSNFEKMMKKLMRKPK